MIRRVVETKFLAKTWFLAIKIDKSFRISIMQTAIEQFRDNIAHVRNLATIYTSAGGRKSSGHREIRFFQKIAFKMFWEFPSSCTSAGGQNLQAIEKSDFCLNLEFLCF